jgi:sugar phosphate permease
MLLAALLNSTKEFLGLVYLIIMIAVVIFGFVGTANPQYGRYAAWPVVVCLAIIGWILFGPS